MKYYGRNKVDYPSLTILEAILSEDFESMSLNKFKNFYTNQKKINKLLDEWVINHKLGTRFIKAYLEDKTDLKFRPAPVRAYIIQEDYFDIYDDINLILLRATEEALSHFKKQGFLYRSVS